MEKLENVFTEHAARFEQLFDDYELRMTQGLAQIFDSADIGLRIAGYNKLPTDKLWALKDPAHDDASGLVAAKAVSEALLLL